MNADIEHMTALADEAAERWREWQAAVRARDDAILTAGAACTVSELSDLLMMPRCHIRLVRARAATSPHV